LRLEILVLIVIDGISDCATGTADFKELVVFKRSLAGSKGPHDRKNSYWPFWAKNKSLEDY